MKRILLSTFVLLAFVSTQAQFTFKPSKKGTLASGSVSEFELVGYGFVKNTGTTTKTFVWRMYPPNLPNSWSAALCDRNLCHDVGVMRGTFDLAAGDSGNIDIHTYPKSTSGTGQVQVLVFEEGDSANAQSQSFDFSAWALSARTPSKVSIEIYPNPATSKLNITLDTDKAINIEVYNVLGQLKKTHVHTGGTSTMDLNDLVAGIYFLRYTDENGKVVSKQFKKLS